MLILGRDLGEWIDIVAPDGQVVASITPHDCTRGRMRIGVECPPPHRVVRRELLRRTP